jgi:hypothetical protein
MKTFRIEVLFCSIHTNNTKMVLNLFLLRFILILFPINFHMRITLILLFIGEITNLFCRVFSIFCTNNAILLFIFTCSNLGKRLKQLLDISTIFGRNLHIGEPKFLCLGLSNLTKIIINRFSLQIGFIS